MDLFRQTFIYDYEVNKDPVENHYERDKRITQAHMMPIDMSIVKKHSDFHNVGDGKNAIETWVLNEAMTGSEIRSSLHKKVKREQDMKVNATVVNMYKESGKIFTAADTVQGIPIRVKYPAVPGTLRTHTVRYHPDLTLPPKVRKINQKKVQAMTTPTFYEPATTKQITKNFLKNDGSHTTLEQVEKQRRKGDGNWNHRPLDQARRTGRLGSYTQHPYDNPMNQTIPVLMKLNSRNTRSNIHQGEMYSKHNY